MFIYTNKDYTARIECTEGRERYFIKFHGQTAVTEIEVDIEIFALYVKEFNKPMERWKNEQRRHIEDSDTDDVIRPGHFLAHMNSLENLCVTKADLDAVLETCTPIQQRRFNLHFYQDYSLSEIAKLERCDESSVRESVKAVTKKIKKYF